MAATVQSRAPLPPQVSALLHALFPSAAELLASAPAADGLGLEVCTLLSACGGVAAAAHEQLAAPLPAGGALRFSLLRAPARCELILMEAFAAALAARLGQMGSCQQVRSRLWAAFHWAIVSGCCAAGNRQRELPLTAEPAR